MLEKQLPLTATFVNTHYVDTNFHRQHSQYLHQHQDEIELLYIKEGSGRYIVDVHEYDVKSGDIIICNANTLHGEALLNDNEMQSYCCVLKNLSLPQLPPNVLMDKKSNPVLSLSINKAVIEHIYLSLHFLNEQETEYEDECQMLANALLNLVYKEVSGKRVTRSPSSKKMEELVQHIMKYLDENYMEEISVQELAVKFHLDYYYLVHFFTRKTGVSPMKYVIQRRIGEAQNLLMNTEMGIGEICSKTGFTDSSYFSSMFKKYVGITPTKYRSYFENKT